MSQLVVRNVDPEVVRALKLRAQEKEKARHFRAGLGQRVKSLVGLGTR